VNRSVLLGATAAIASDCLRSPFNLPDQTLAMGTYRAPFGITVYPTPSLRAITYRLNSRRSDTVVTYKRSIKMRLLHYWHRGRHDWRSIRLQVRKTIC